MKHAFTRYSKGPLYSAKELARAEAILQERGFSILSDMSIGSDTVRIYDRAIGENRREQAVIYTGGGPNSGVMILAGGGPDGELRGTTVWGFVRECDGTYLGRMAQSIRASLFPK